MHDQLAFGGRSAAVCGSKKCGLLHVCVRETGEKPKDSHEHVNQIRTTADFNLCPNSSAHYASSSKRLVQDMLTVLYSVPSDRYITKHHVVFQALRQTMCDFFELTVYLP